jgi:hypothetical protein
VFFKILHLTQVPPLSFIPAASGTKARLPKASKNVQNQKALLKFDGVKLIQSTYMFKIQCLPLSKQTAVQLLRHPLLLHWDVTK